MSHSSEKKLEWSSHPRQSSVSGPSLRVLAPIDFDDESHRSRLTAIELAAQWGAEVTLLHVTPRAPLAATSHTGLDAIGLLHRALQSPAGPAASYDDQELQLRRLQQTALRRLRSIVPASLENKIAFDFVWRAGDVAQEIVGYAKERQIDVIVLGENRRSRPWRISRGIARRVIQTAPCQVLVAYPSGQTSVERSAIESVAS